MAATRMNSFRDETHQPHAAASIHQIDLPRHLNSNTSQVPSAAACARHAEGGRKEEKERVTTYQLLSELHGSILVTVPLACAAPTEDAHPLEP